MSQYFVGSLYQLSEHTLARAGSINALTNAIDVGFAALPPPSELVQISASIVTATGTANALAVALVTAPASYSAVTNARIRVAVTNTDAATLNINGMGVAALLRPDGTPLLPADLRQGAIITVAFDGAAFRATSGLLPMGPASRAYQDAVAGGFTGTEPQFRIALAALARGDYLSRAGGNMNGPLGGTTLVLSSFITVGGSMAVSGYASFSAGVGTSGAYSVGGSQVVAARQANVVDATGAGDVVVRLNDLLARLRTHGLIG